MDPMIIVFGFGVGLLVGLTGTGGGSVMTPLLVLVFGIDPATAIGTDIAYAAITKSVGGVKQYRANRVDRPLSKAMLLGSVPGALIGVFLLTKLESALGSDFDTVIFSLLAGALLLSGAALLARIFLVSDQEAKERESVDLHRGERIIAGTLGAFVGLVLGLTSAGSGALIAVGLITIFRLVPQRVVGTDLFHASIVLIVAGLAHVVAGDIDYGLAANLLVGSIPGIWLSSKIALRAPTGALRIALAVILVGAGLGMLTKAGVTVPTSVLAAFPAIVIALVAGAAINAVRSSGGIRAAGTAPGSTGRGARRDASRVAALTSRLHVTRLTETRWEARWFAIGSICFALGALPGYTQLVGVTADDATYAVGSVFFTIAALVQLLLSPRFKRGSWRSAAWSDWWSAAVQFAGTLLFNLSTFSALFTGLTAQQQNRAIWQPDAYGSVAFLVASLLAVHATTITDRLWDPTSRTWEVTWLNLVGSLAFGVSAIAGYVSPNTGHVAHAELANLGTFVGALCFLAGALLTSPRPDPAGRAG